MGGNPPVTNVKAGQRSVNCRCIILLLGLAVVVGGLISLLLSGDKFLLSSGLPSNLAIYGRDGFIQTAVNDILHQKPESRKHIAIRGGPGMGKTTSGIGIIHDPRIVGYFGNGRHWVNCREASDVADDMKALKLLEYISGSLGLDLAASSDRQRDIQFFLDNNNVPRIIVLDNFETMWEPPAAREAVEGILQFLAQFTQLTMILTTRNAHNPATHLGVSWHQFKPIQPLQLDASRSLFTSLSPQTSIDSRLDDLLRAVGCNPLAIVLMASSAQENYTTSSILEIWNSRLSERNKTRNDDGDPLNILDRSIAMSLEGPLIKSYPEAPVLLRIIAELPGGIRLENLHTIAPLISDVDRVKGVLIRTSLLDNSPDVLQMHSTIRSYMLRNYALDASHKENIQAFYFQLIHEAGNEPGTQDFLESARRLSDENTNAEAVLLDALEHELWISVWIAMDYLNYLIWNTPSIDMAKKIVGLLRDQLLSGEMVSTSTESRGESWWYMPALKDCSWEAYIHKFVSYLSAQTNINMTGSAHRTRGDTCQRQPPPPTDSLLSLALLRLGTLYFRLDNYPEATKALEEAAGRFEKLDQSSEASQAKNQLAEIYRLRGNHTGALQLYSEAYNRFEHVGDTVGMSASQRGVGIIYFQDNRSREALEILEMAQKTCLPDDYTCIADCERELGRVYRYHNQTESIRLSTSARNYYLLHGPRRHAAITLYQKSIALYSQGNYDDAEAGFNDAFEEFRPLKNDAQMGYCIYHLAEMNRMRGSQPQALALFRRSETMFEHMGNRFMVGLSVKAQAELHAKLCQPDEAGKAYNRTHAFLVEVDAKEAILDTVPSNQDILNMCELSIWQRYPTLQSFLICSFNFLCDTLYSACVWVVVSLRKKRDRSPKLGEKQ
ncbi:hypothetical protein CVT25_003643 [Psilocybe cyanescens]|uniref:Uncharacterized protein n=1 Tax=Psilocybe cyanescens TaxID=93625 RepID=A0A409WPD4_PSICY|nr:hypothetical protein CVT25_003643 [Psilocybe cyanescens]